MVEKSVLESEIFSGDKLIAALGLQYDTSFSKSSVRTFFPYGGLSWKNEFSLNHINSFKKSAGDILIELGYEKDFSW